MDVIDKGCFGGYNENNRKKALEIPKTEVKTECDNDEVQ